MRAVVIESFSEDLSGLAVRDVPDPWDIDRHSVLVRVEAAGINPSDVKSAQGAFSDSTLPRIPGRDFAGVVLEGPKNLVGCEVWGSGGDIGYTRDGSHAQLITVPSTGVWPKPTSLSFDHASAVGVPFLAAWLGLIDRARLTTHDTVLVVGASGAVGGAAVQIARWKGGRVIGAFREENQTDRLRRLGADEVIVLSRGDLGEEVRRLTDGKGANIVFDTVGGVMFEHSLSTLAVGGRLVQIAATGQRRVSFDLLDFYRRDLRLYGVNTRHMTTIDGARILEGLTPGFDAGLLQAPQIAGAFGLAEAHEAYQFVAKGKTLGQAILKPQF